jgi:predicted SAM-dependent methyltransferase
MVEGIKHVLKQNSFVLSSVRTIRSYLGYTPNALSLVKIRKDTPLMISEYLRSYQNRKLQIGCQCHPIAGWLNVDLEPKDSRIAFMDATRTFPLPDESFDYVFSEHMIEHISLEEGYFMIGECFRVLKPGGKIRIATPNIRFLYSLLADPENPNHQSYIQFSSRYFKQPLLHNEVTVVNNFFRDWGHKFIYDKETLKQLFQLNQFSDIRFCKVYESADPVLQHLEKHGLEITDTFNELETLIIEATK